MANKVAEALGFDQQAVEALPGQIRAQAFFERLASKHGISPQTEDEAQEFLAASDRLEAKRAELAKASNPVSKALGILGVKTAGAPAGQKSTAASQSVDVQQKVAAIMSRPELFGGLLAVLSDNTAE